MPIIKTYEKNEASGELAELYEEIVKTRGELGNNAKLFSSSPKLLKQQMDFIKYYIKHPTLSLPLLASIRIMISRSQDCDFCVDYNTAMLINIAKWSIDQIEVMKKDVEKANLSPKEIEMLKFCIKAIHNSHEINKNDMENLYSLGWSDKDILDALNHASRMLATDIIFNTFKIEEYK